MTEVDREARKEVCKEEWSMKNEQKIKYKYT